MSAIPKIPRASGGQNPLAPYQGYTLDQLGTLSSPQTPRLLTPPLTTNPGSVPDMCSRNQWGMSIERSILYIMKDNSCYKKTTDVGGDVDQSHTAKNLNF